MRTIKIAIVDSIEDEYIVPDTDEFNDYDVHKAIGNALMAMSPKTHRYAESIDVYCPTCGHHFFKRDRHKGDDISIVRTIPAKPNFCPNCGRRLDWRRS